MSAASQRAYVARQRAADPEGWREKRRAASEKYRRADPERQRAHVAANQRANPEKHRARARVRYAIRIGRLVRPDACEECKTACRPDAAHVDYDRPLDVRWLCRPCHAAFDWSRKR